MSEMRDLGGVVWLVAGWQCGVQWHALPYVFRHLRGVLRRAEGGGGGECFGCGSGVARDGASVDARSSYQPASGVGAALIRQAAELS